MGIPLNITSVGSLLFVFVTAAISAESPQTTLSAQKLKAAAHFVQPFLGELDCENVGYAQIGEVDEHYFPIFKVYDSDHSQIISKEELLGDPYVRDKALQQLSFDLMDINKDGKATPDELRNYLIDSLKLLDGNGDDDVYPDEFMHAYKTGQVLKKSNNQPLSNKMLKVNDK